MSCLIRTYKSMELGGPIDSSDSLHLTAFVGDQKSKHSVQFTIGSKYCALGEDAIRDLINTLQSRLNCTRGYTATDNERKDIEFIDKE
jgi:hypothetical protein